MLLLDNKEVLFGKFPNGESNLNFNKLAFGFDAKVTLKFESDNDLFNLFILKNLMDEVFPVNNYELKILYMPYSRMDRRNSTYTFNLKYVCNLINSLAFKKVIVYDAHSEVTSALLNNVVDKTNIPALFAKFRNEVPYKDLHIFYPDAGAQKKYSGGTFNYPSLIGSKVRDFASGNIINYEVFGLLKTDSDVLIVDDLCSKGGTFIGAAKILKDMGAGNVYLLTGHCENTIYEGEIFKTDLIAKVFTTNSILSDWPALGVNKRIDITRLYSKEI
jgi:ribose-phosphate pyrophosphokinase